MTKSTKNLITFFLIFVFLTGLTLLFLNLVFQVVPINGTSMTPTILDGDKVLVLRPAKAERGQVYVFYNPDTDSAHKKLIKRIIGLPGDVIETVPADGGGFLFCVNGEILSETYVSKVSYIPQSRVVVPADKFYYLGDNRGVSSDSREGYLGNMADVIGKVLLRFNTADGLQMAAVS